LRFPEVGKWLVVVTSGNNWGCFVLDEIGSQEVGLWPSSGSMGGFNPPSTCRATALDHSKAARIISEASGRTVAYHALTEEQMLDGARSHGMPEPVVAYMGVLYAVVRAGLAAGVSDDFHTITATKPMTFEAFARSATWT
jgi:hypothetical protein